jgi:hypothetical protein
MQLQKFSFVNDFSLISGGNQKTLFLIHSSRIVNFLGKSFKSYNVFFIPEVCKCNKKNTVLNVSSS